MNKWHYLGLTKIWYNIEDAETKLIEKNEHIVYLFTSQTDIKKRSYHIVGGYADRMTVIHPFITQCLEPWTIGNQYWWTHVLNEPSTFLKNHMYDIFNAIWDIDAKWWKIEDTTILLAPENKETKFSEVKNNGN